MGEQGRGVARLLEATERSQSENNRAMTKAATEINITAREQAQAFDQLGSSVINLADRLDRVERLNASEGLREAVMNMVQKGISLQRFKGLGEMNADQLAETTMDPASRTLAQVKIEDAVEADLNFSMLMGDQVEPRRVFIEDHARCVANLDV